MTATDELLPTTGETPVPDRRAEFIAGLRALADFLAAHPDLPVPRCPELTVHTGLDGVGGRLPDEQARAEVDRVAAVLGVPAAAADCDDSHYSARRMFGPVEYGAIAIRSEHMRRHAAYTSYSGAVEP